MKLFLFAINFLLKVQRGDEMLILSRKSGETIWIGEDVELVISEVKGDQVKIGIRAPRSIEVVRGELRQDVSNSNAESVVTNLDLLKKPK